MVGLTQRQQMVLEYIRQTITDGGYPRRLREIGAQRGIRSTNGVNDHLRALERKGYLTREDMKSRALRPLPFGPGGAQNGQTGDDDFHAASIPGNGNSNGSANGANGSAHRSSAGTVVEADFGG